jgi:hypothetical protein
VAKATTLADDPEDDDDDNADDDDPTPVAVASDAATSRGGKAARGAGRRSCASPRCARSSSGTPPGQESDRCRSRGQEKAQDECRKQQGGQEGWSAPGGNVAKATTLADDPEEADDDDDYRKETQALQEIAMGPRTTVLLASLVVRIAADFDGLPAKVQSLHQELARMTQVVSQLPHAAKLLRANVIKLMDEFLGRHREPAGPSHFRPDHRAQHG